MERGAQKRSAPVRWIETPDIIDVRKNLALEEAIFWSNEGVTVRLWENQRSVIIGRGQYAAFETDLDYCVSQKIPLVRRFTGGGAVYNGPGNVNWSFFVTDGGGSGRLRFERGVREIFGMGAEVVIEALGRLGIRASLDPPNRIVTSEGKVSGMAAFLTKDRLLCHGTLLLNADLEEAQRLTKPRDVSAANRYVRSRHVIIANLGVGVGAFGTALKKVVEVRTEDATVPGLGGLKGDELEMAEKLASKYNNPEWNLGDPFALGGIAG